MKTKNGNLISGHFSINIEGSKDMAREQFNDIAKGNTDHDINDVWNELQKLNGNEGNSINAKPAKKS